MNEFPGGISPAAIDHLRGSVSIPGSAVEFAEALVRQQPGVLRCRRGISEQDLPLPTSPIAWYSLARRPVEPSSRASRMLAFAAADYYLQDAGSLLALAAAGADTSSLRGKLICDLCAAPGGKASALVEAVSECDLPGDESFGGGFVLANEAIRSRLGALQLNLARTGSDRYAISNLDPDALADRLPGVFDLVVVDAPCSGQALLGRGRQTTGSLSAKQIYHCALRQRRILDAATRLLRRGGRLVYSTCTFAEAENEAQVQRLCSVGMARADEIAHLAPYRSTSALQSDGCFRLWPHLHDCAGSFAASMTVADDWEGDRDEPAAFRSVRRRTSRRRPRPDRLPVDPAVWYRLAHDEIRLTVLESVLLGWPPDAPPWVDEIATGGPELAFRTGRTWKPAHAGALRRVPRGQSLQAIEIDRATAKIYLRGEPIGCQRPGWQVVRLAGRPLGWIMRGKNHLPSAARMSGPVLP